MYIVTYVQDSREASDGYLLFLRRNSIRGADPPSPILFLIMGLSCTVNGERLPYRATPIRPLLSRNTSHKTKTLKRIYQTETKATMNNHLLSSVILAIVAIFTTIPLASGFVLLSPLLLRVDPAGIVARINKSSSSVTTDSSRTISPNKASKKTLISRSRQPLSSVDFGLDEDMMRYKHELLSAVYEKSLKRGFE